jgi:hypothetical protein
MGQTLELAQPLPRAAALAAVPLAPTASVYIDGGFADKLEKAKKFALRPGTHDIELRDSDGRTLYQERVAVTVGKTTELRVG